MRTAKENKAIANTLSLGILATKLGLSLYGMKEGTVFLGDKTVLDQWAKILEETISFLSAGGKPDIASAEDNVSARFLARAPYLEPLREAIPATSKTELEGVTQYLEETYRNMLVLREDKTLDPEEQNSLLSFVNSIGERCVQEVSRFRREPHPKWPHKIVIAPM